VIKLYKLNSDIEESRKRIYSIFEKVLDIKSHKFIIIL